MKPFLWHLVLTISILHHDAISASPTLILNATQPFSNLSKSDSATRLATKDWPHHRYRMTLPDNFYLQISANRYTHFVAPSRHHLQGFIFSFSDNIEAENPPPGLSPRRASQLFYDTDSFTRFGIQERVMGVLANPAPTAILCKALAMIAVQVRKYGPPGSLHGLIYQSGERRFLPAKAFNLITLEISQLGWNGTYEAARRVARRW